MNTAVPKNTATVLLDDIETVTKRALQAHGASEVIAAHVAHAVRVAEADGNRICGLYYLESYCQQLDSGRVDGQVEPVVSHDRERSRTRRCQVRFRSECLRRWIRHRGCGRKNQRDLRLRHRTQPHMHVTGLLHRTVRRGRADRYRSDELHGLCCSSRRITASAGNQPNGNGSPRSRFGGGVSVRFQHQRGGSWQDHHGGRSGYCYPHRLGGGRERQRHNRPRSSIARVAGFGWRIQGLWDWG